MWEKFRDYMLRKKQYSYDVALLLTRYKNVLQLTKWASYYSLKISNNFGHINVGKSAVIHIILVM